MSSRGVLFLESQPGRFAAHDLAAKHMPGIHIEASATLPDPESSAAFRAIIPWNYGKLIPGASRWKNLVVFHSSDLPRGRGWAPVYYTLAQGLDQFTITAFKPDEGADTGPVLAKCRFPVAPGVTAPYLRRFSQEAELMLLGKLLERYPDVAAAAGTPQTHLEGTRWPKRSPDDNEIPLSATLADVLPHLRACEPRHPAFFVADGAKYTIVIEPAEPPRFPLDDLRFEFFDDPERKVSL